MPGVMDEYLTPEEEAYFKSHGSNEDAAEKIVSDVVESQDDESREEISEKTIEADLEPENKETEEEEAETEEINESEVKPKRDLEKAFKSEHFKRKQLKVEVEAAQSRARELEEQLQKMRDEIAKQQQEQQAKLAQPEPEEIPDPEADPLGFYNYKINQLEKATKQHTEYLQQQHQAQQQRQAYDQFINTYRASTEEYLSKVPDYKDAYSFLYNERYNELLDAGYNAQQADALAKEDEMAIVAKAYQDRVNPAERLYKLATRRGFAVKASPKTKTLDSVEKGLKKSSSLKAGGLPPERDATLGDIDDMNWDEFDNYFQQVKQKAKGR